MKKGLAYALVGFLSFSMIQTPALAYENAESEIVIESSDATSDEISDAPEDEDLLYEDSFYSEADLFYDSYGNAASMLASMDIVAIDGHTYHISDFSEEYVCVF